MPAAMQVMPLHGLRGPVPGEPLFLFSGGMLLLILGLVLRRRFRREPVATTAEVDEADTDALLLEIAADYRLDLCTGEQSLLRLDGLLRSTLAAAHAIPAMRLTSLELQGSLRILLDTTEMAPLVDFLALVDRAKFAGHDPMSDEIEAALEAVAAVLRGACTRPSP